VEGTGSEVVEWRCARVEVLVVTVGSETDGGGMSVWAYSKWWMADDIGSPQAARRLAVTDLVLAWLDTRRTAPAWTLERDSGPLQFSLR
jgi:hypothetical protein